MSAIAGLPSLAAADGSEASGPSDVVVNPDGNLTAVIQGVGSNKKYAYKQNHGAEKIQGQKTD